jgi:hypothetical protein
MELVVLKPENLPEQLRILANDVQNKRSVQEQFEEASKRDTLVGRILNPVRHGTSMKEITVAECSETNRRLYSQGREYVPDDIELQVRPIK